MWCVVRAEVLTTLAMDDSRTPVGAATSELVPRDVLAAACGGDRVEMGPAGEWLVRCAAEAELGAVLRACAERGADPAISSRRTVAPADGGVMCVGELDQVTGYDVDSGVVTAGPGCTAGALREALADNEQWLPPIVDCTAEQALGAIACGRHVGTLASSFGPLSAYVLAVRMVLRNGDIIALGCQARKDVTGYDIMRYALSTAGGSGVVTSATFRVIARPPAWASLALPCESLDAALAAARHIDDDIHPAGVACAGASPDSGQPPVTVVRLAGTAEAVRLQREAVARVVSTAHSDSDAVARSVWHLFDDRGCRRAGGVRAVVPVAALAQVCRQVADAARLIACPVDGRIVAFPASPRGREALNEAVASAGGTSDDSGVNSIPAALRQRLGNVFRCSA